jgi:lipopolysaccharide transport system ATP-binding protein
MYMRLAFSVAAHLEPEILLIDEVLAVGDAVFQTRCLAQMKKVTQQGKTVLFVSHNMGAVSSVCKRAIVIESGNILFNGDVFEAIHFYERVIFQTKYLNEPLTDRPDRKGTGDIRLVNFRIENESGEEIRAIPNGKNIRLCFDFKTNDLSGTNNVDLNIIVENMGGNRIFQFGTRFTGQQFQQIPHIGSIICLIKRFPLVPGRYRLNISLESKSSTADAFTPMTYFDVVDGDFYGSGYQIFENESPFIIDGTWSFS